MGEELYLRVDVPIASFRSSYAREYWETFPFPPPSTVYGMLLSMVGEEDRSAHVGAELALALTPPFPVRSKVFRTVWKLKSNSPLGQGNNKRPDFQEVLAPVCLMVGVRVGKDRGSEPLVARLRRMVDNPASVSRFGGLCLGESPFLVDGVRRVSDFSVKGEGRVLVVDGDGNLGLPVWVDHVGSLKTVWGRFRIDRREGPWDRILSDAWIRIESPSEMG